jgi:hypothetical protein
MALSILYHLFHGSQFYWWRNPKYSEKTTDLSKVTDKQTLSHTFVLSTPREEWDLNSKLKW